MNALILFIIAVTIVVIALAAAVFVDVVIVGLLMFVALVLFIGAWIVYYSAKYEGEDVESYVPEVEEPEAKLSKMPVETIEGIGSEYGRLLRDAGYPSVAELLQADPERVAEVCGVGTEKAERWIAMSHFTLLDSASEEDAEAIVIATGIANMAGLASADADDLLSKIREAVSNGNVRVPEGYTFDIERVRLWIKEAKRLV
jgi:hypothetical protein